VSAAIDIGVGVVFSPHSPKQPGPEVGGIQLTISPIPFSFPYLLPRKLTVQKAMHASLRFFRSHSFLFLFLRWFSSRTFADFKFY